MEETIKASAIVEHSSQCSHDLQPRILCRESLFHHRKIKEACYIRHNASINRDRGTEISQAWTGLIDQTDDHKALLCCPFDKQTCNSTQIIHMRTPVELLHYSLKSHGTSSHAQSPSRRLFTSEVQVCMMISPSLHSSCGHYESPQCGVIDTEFRSHLSMGCLDEVVRSIMTHQRPDANGRDMWRKRRFLTAASSGRSPNVRVFKLEPNL
uniref:Uncharacterized protein n=1 Tax=Trichuris muris TaxID=70415 RepID=A0A5S6QGT2_TRIMR